MRPSVTSEVVESARGHDNKFSVFTELLFAKYIMAYCAI